ncbi:MAG: YkgJ family cysteine cluster protein [Candidatus Bathyarchaeia archaeon]
MNKQLSRQTNFISICSICKSKCCKGARPPLSSSRIQIIEDYLLERGIVPRFDRREYSFPYEREDGYCSLLDVETGYCIVHEVKPETCVAGPITFDIDAGRGVIEWYLKTEDICLLAGVLARNRMLLLEHLLSARREILHLVNELSSTELKAILRIEEEHTVKIGEECLPELIVKKLI